MEDPAGKLARARAAVEPYAWRRLTPEALARHVLTAAGHRPADVDNHVGVVASALDGLAWRTLTAGTVCRHLLNALDASLQGELLFDLELWWLLDESA
jgi:hypothetical protein